MLDINELEQRWLRYKIKSYIPHGVIVISLIVIISIVVLFMGKMDTKESVQVAQKKKQLPQKQQNIAQSKPKPTQQVTHNTIKKAPQKTQLHQEPVYTKQTQQKIVLQPSLGFMKNMQQSSLPYYETSPLQNTPQTQMQQPTTRYQQLKQQPKLIQNEVVTSTQTVEEDKIIPEEESKKITIQRHNAREDIAGVIKRFKKNNNPALSLFVAKKYYELGEYRKSYNYALITNQINSNIEASWLIFAKSLVKLGEKEMAIKTLTKYVQSSNSGNARLLLNEIKQGKFR